MAMNNARLEAVEQKLAYLYRWHHELVSELRADQLEHRATMNEKMSVISQKLEQLFRDFEGISRPREDSMHAGNNPNSIPIQKRTELSPNLDNRRPPIEFPRFNGDNPRSWFRKCDKYFLFFPMAENEKVYLASMYMEDKAEFFYVDYVAGKGDIGWERFSEMVLERFGDPCGKNAVGAFIKVQQEDSVEMYVKKFEESKAFMVQQMNRKFPEEYFVTCFVNGLKEEIRNVVDERLSPATLTRAIELARIQECLLEMNGMREVGLLCLNCDEPDCNEHMCKKSSFVMAEEDDEMEVQKQSNTKVKVYALANHNTPNAIKLKGSVKDETISIMVSRGSSHSFLDPRAVSRVGCEIEHTDPFLVTLGNGREIECNSKCSGFGWEMRGVTFTADVRILKLGGTCDMVLGVDFLTKLGQVVFDFERPSISIIRDGKILNIKGKRGEPYRLVID